MSVAVLTSEQEASARVKPVSLGPTWVRRPEGGYVRPEFTLGWHVLEWAHRYLKQPDGEPWFYTKEQSRLTLWWFALDPDTGRFLYRDGVIQRLKGWGLRQGPTTRHLGCS